MVTTLHTTFFGPVQWYQQLYRSEGVFINPDEPYQKQTVRNHCLIAAPNGVQKLTVPIEHPSPTQHPSPISQIRISSHGNWQRQHWHALQTAYGDSPFFIYYEDDIRPFFYEDRWEYLFDYNMDIMKKMCELLDIQPNFVEEPLPPSTLNHIIRFFSSVTVSCRISAFWIYFSIWATSLSISCSESAVLIYSCHSPRTTPFSFRSSIIAMSESQNPFML